MSGRPSWHYGDHPPACTCADCLGQTPGGRRNLLKILIAIGVAVLALFAIWKYRNKG